ncbi:hypothetical protein [Parasphingorhabdus cellanae]|nr:hypothetical protein [Parasphingorhabdus cellanae]
MTKPVFNTILIYAMALALAAFALQWLEYKFFLKSIPTRTAP